MMVSEELKNLQIPFSFLELGTVEIQHPLSKELHDKLKKNLMKSGLELLDDKKTILIERVKNLVVEMVHYSDEEPPMNFSEYLSEKLDLDYSYLSNLFSEVKGITIQQYIIQHKIERAKELILYDELNLSEIAFKLHYSSVAHFSNQFKKITGLTPSFFKALKKKKRKFLEEL